MTAPDYEGFARRMLADEPGNAPCPDPGCTDCVLLHLAARVLVHGRPAQAAAILMFVDMLPPDEGVAGALVELLASTEAGGSMADRFGLDRPVSPDFVEEIELPTEKLAPLMARRLRKDTREHEAAEGVEPGESPMGRLSEAADAFAALPMPMHAMAVVALAIALGRDGGPEDAFAALCEANPEFAESVAEMAGEITNPARDN